MDIEKLREVVRIHKAHLEHMGISPVEFTDEQYQELVTGKPLLEHCLWMLCQMEIWLHPENVTANLFAKCNGWRGFVQGCFAALQIQTISELRDISRPR